MPNRRARRALGRPTLVAVLAALGASVGPMRATAGEPGAGPALERLDQIAPAVAACWAAPPGLRVFEAVEVTARFSLRRDGTLIGPPRVTFASADVALAAREVLTRSAVEAIRACTPLRISLGLGHAIAGRPFAIRFIYKGPQGRGA